MPDPCHLASGREPPAWTAPYLGIPFKDLGRDWDGCDCYGAGRLVMMHERGVQLPLYLDYEDARDGEGINRLLHRELEDHAAHWRPVTGPLGAFDWLILRRQDLAGAARFHLALVAAPPSAAGPGWAFHTLRGGCTTNERLDSIALRMEGSVTARYRYAPEDR